MTTYFQKAPRESLEFVLATFIAQLLRHPDLPRKEFIAANLQFAPELTKFFSYLDSIQGVSSPVDSAESDSACWSEDTPWNESTYQALRSIVLDDSKSSPTTEQSTDLDDLDLGQSNDRRDMDWEAAETLEEIDVHATRQLGPYKLLKKIADGGMGTVWLAQQTEPIRRRVAIKVIRADLDSQTVAARFEAERQAIGMMNHPNIAQLLDAGTTQEGQPYFVMELVQGGTITEYCDTNRLSIQDRLKIFQTVCKAIQHAHQKGIIHRDLKPSNILVAQIDGVPIPKVVDFGLAKALDQHTVLTDKTLNTYYGQVVGTLQYMSPEQADMSTLDIDTRSDIYSLGVLLYEMLTGSTPLSRETVRTHQVLTVLKSIRESEPISPSVRLQHSTEELERICEKRCTDPKRLNQIIQGELDWIVMKSLDKERSRRYATAMEFAQDISRFLDGSPVEAGPPSKWYRTRKFLAKNRTTCLAISLIIVTFLIGFIGITLGLIEANNQREIAQSERQSAERSAKNENEQRKRAEENFAQANLAKANAESKSLELERVIDFQRQYLAGLDLNQFARVLKTTVLEKQRSAQSLSIDEASVTRSLEEINWVDVARVLMQKTIFDRAKQLLDDGFGGSDLLTIQLLDSVSNMEDSIGLVEDSLATALRSSKKATEVYGENHRETLRLESQLVHRLLSVGDNEGAFKLGESVLTRCMQQFGEEDRDTLIALNNVAGIYLSQGKWKEAEQSNKRLYEIRSKLFGENHPDTIMSLNNLGGTYQMQGDWQRSADCYSKVLAAQMQMEQKDNFLTLMTMNNLAYVLRKQEKYEEAERLFTEAITTSRENLGNDHPMTATLLLNAGFVYADQKRWEEAEPYFVEAFETRNRVLGLSHPNTFISLQNLTWLHEQRGQTEKLIQTLEKATLGFSTANLDHTDESIRISMQLAEVLIEDGQKPRALMIVNKHLEKDVLTPEQRSKWESLKTKASE